MSANDRPGAPGISWLTGALGDAHRTEGRSNPGRPGPATGGTGGTSVALPAAAPNWQAGRVGVGARRGRGLACGSAGIAPRVTIRRLHAHGASSRCGRLILSDAAGRRGRHPVRLVGPGAPPVGPSIDRSRPARPSTRGPAGRRGSAGRSCPRTARARPRGRSASRRPGARPGRAPPGRCRRPRPSRAGWPRSSAQARPLASSTPRRWLRDRFEPQVAMRSPIPASPAKVSGLAPATIPSRVISARPRVSSPALPLSPKPSSSAAPAAIATTFLSAPHSSTPRMSSLTYRRNRRRASRATIRWASARSRRRDDRRGGQVARHLGGEIRARQGGHPADRDAGRLGDDLAHPQQRVALEALDHGQQVGVGREERGAPPPRSSAGGRTERRRGRDRSRRAGRPGRRSR